MNRLLLATIAASLAPLATQAATLVETDPFLIDTTTGTTSSATASFNQFNAALGTLTGVSIEFTGSADSVYSALTSSTTSVTTTGTSTTTLQLTGTGLTTLATPTLSAGATNGVVNANTGSNPYTVTYFPGTSSAFDLFGAVSSSSLAAYTGSGTVALQALFPNFTSSGSINTAGSPGSFSAVGGGGQANGNVILTFDYTPVPLPPALPLLLSGIAGLGLMIKRRIARA